MVFYSVDRSITLVFMNTESVQRVGDLVERVGELVERVGELVERVGELVERVGELVEPTSFLACHHPYRPFRLLDLTLPVDQQ
jgi:hypothetical protein